MYESSLKLLIEQGIEFEQGLTPEEIVKIEKIYDIKLPDSLREFLMTALPISQGFYDWRNIQNKNIQFLKQIMNRPILDVYNMAQEVYWCDDWGEEPESGENIMKEVRERLKKAPSLFPIYAHRYMPIILEENPPIISIHGIDIIYYGENLEDYFNIEFGNKMQNAIEIQNIKPIPFWPEIM